MTKIDKTSHHRVLHNLLDISKYRVQHMPGALPQIFLVRSVSGGHFFINKNEDGSLATI